MSDSAFQRRLPIGAEPVDARTTHVRLWAPRARRVEVVTAGGARTALAPEADGYVSGTIEARAGDRYQFKLDGDEKLYPDPASRFQPEGPHGPSQIVDPAVFRWTDAAWSGVRRNGQVASRVDLLKEVWGYGAFILTRTVDSHIAELRRKVDDGDDPRHIITVWKVGYRFER